VNARGGKRTLSVTCLAEIVWIGYRAQMPLSLHKIARYVAQKAASNPEAREKAVKVARGVVDEAKQIAPELTEKNYHQKISTGLPIIIGPSLALSTYWFRRA